MKCLKYYTGMGTDVTAYVAELEAKASRLVVVEAELAKLKATEPEKAVESTPVAISKKKSK